MKQKPVLCFVVLFNHTFNIYVFCIFLLCKLIGCCYCSPNVEIVRDNPQHEAYLTELFNALIQEIENKAALVAPTDFVLKMRLGEAAKLLKQKYR